MDTLHSPPNFYGVAAHCESVGSTDRRMIAHQAAFDNEALTVFPRDPDLVSMHRYPH
jgi:hypothetical protein